MSLQGSNVPLMDLLGITNNVALEWLEFGKYIKPDGNYTPSVRGPAILVLLLAIASGLVSFHIFAIEGFTCFLSCLVALFLVNCYRNWLIVRCCPYYRYNLPLLIQ